MFKVTQKLEAEIITMVKNLLHGDSETCGVSTSGGTESIMMAMLAYRNWAREEKGIFRPNIVTQHTRHAAFTKACMLFDIEERVVPYNSNSQGRVDLNTTRKYIDSNTICLVGSAYAFPHGQFDDIEGLSKLARNNNIGLHTDSCLGGFILAFVEKAGYDIPEFDFRVPGVTSMSVDTHKYGFGPKGLSLCMFRPKKLRTFIHYKTRHWIGGIFTSPTFWGSRPGPMIAGTWATMMKLGKNGYI